MDPCHELPVCGGAEVEGCSPAGSEEIVHVLSRSPVLPVCPCLDICLSKLPCLDSLWSEDLSVDLYERIPLVVRSLRVEGVCWCAMIEVRNRFLEPSASGVSVSLSLLSPIGLIGAVTGIRLVRPLPEWDRRDSVPSCGREGYCVLPKSGKRVWGVGIVGRRVMPELSPGDGQCLPGKVGWGGVDLFGLEVIVVEDRDGLIPLDLRESSFSIPWIPRSCGIVRVASGASIRSLAPWVCGLGTPYVPCRGVWVDRLRCWGATPLVRPRGIVSWEILLTREVFVGGGTPNRDHLPVNGTGGGRWASGCQICMDRWSSLLEAGDDIVDWERGGSEVSSWGSPSSEESQSL